MITIVAKSIVKEGKLETFKALAQEMVEKSRKEKGCITYQLYQDIHNDHVMTFIEEWEDMESVEAHQKTEHFEKNVPKMKALRHPSSEMTLYKKYI
ncbi:Quinol monooxygenase YgiN [Tindallia magadiensis]|uniref:Quinol monooxygenase YgiN n=1 Tax=Tindallia magadiensis TaxID=69895 RepID=A0A1I3B258_9FIRM|nr:putative quinol monooxygenase [Tindallia magadiensis]SFH56260.1 Quinol monooxygenase YgiN [Tindallia magadiensis]